MSTVISSAIAPRLDRHASIELAVTDGIDSVREDLVAWRVPQLLDDGVHLRVDLIRVVNKQGLDGAGRLGSAELFLAVVGEKRVLEQEQGLLREARNGARGVSHEVAAQNDVADQVAFLGVACLDRMILQLA